MPISAISLIDETCSWLKSACGLDKSEVPRELAFCVYTLLSDEPGL